MINYYINKEGVIQHRKEIIGNLRNEHGDNWREIFHSIWSEYSEDNPLVSSYPKIEDKYYEIPTSFVLENISNDTIWGNGASCFSAINKDLYSIINRVTERGDYPYNSTIAEEFCKDNEIPYDKDCHFLNSIVYCTQQFKHEKDRIEADNKEREEMAKNNFKKLTIEDITNIIEKDLKCFVQINGTTFLGGSCKKISEHKMRLRKNGDGFIWMPPKATRKGYNAHIGQYYKTIN